LGIHAPAERTRTTVDYECARRKDPNQPVLEKLIRGAALPCARRVILRAERRRKPATWHWFALNGGERPLFAFPGIWRNYRGPTKKDDPNVDIETYAFLTTTPNSLFCTINHERMPVILTREEEFETWLRGSAKEAFALAREYPPDRMRIVQEGFGKEDLVGVA
jgi:hypothetical protein